MLVRLLWIIAAGLAAVAGAVVIKTVSTPSRQIDLPAVPAIAVDQDGAADRLAGAVRIRTISTEQSPGAGAQELAKLHLHLQASYPNAHRVLKRELVDGYSLLYAWVGSKPEDKPMLLMAHQDVVPIAPGTESAWQHPPFEGVRKDGFVWGRGAWDDKGNLIAQMEAVEMLAAGGFRPERTIYLAFGHNEETSGRGAKAIAELLKSRGVKLDFVIDEGLLITEGMLPGISKPVALIGIAEKGNLSVQLRTTATPGHSSMPPPPGSSAIAMMSTALNQIETNRFPGAIRGVAREMLETLAPEMRGFGRVALSNLWLFEPVVRRQLEAGASTNAMLRTTTALTVINAGNKENVLPGIADATVNFRLLPGDTMDSVVTRVKALVGHAKVEVKPLPGGSNPSAISPTQSSSYQRINRTVRELFPGTVVAPGLMIGATDSRHFEGISDHIYKFSPVRAKPEDLSRFHGTDERISETNLVELIGFYHRLLLQGAGARDTATK